MSFLVTLYPPSIKSSKPPEKISESEDYNEVYFPFWKSAVLRH